MRFIDVSASSRSSSAKLGISTCFWIEISRTIRTVNSSANNEIILVRIFIRSFVTEIAFYSRAPVLFHAGHALCRTGNETWFTLGSHVRRWSGAPAPVD